MQCSGYSRAPELERGQIVGNWLFPAALCLWRLFRGQDWYQPYLHALIASDLDSDQDTGKEGTGKRDTGKREFPQKGQECFYFPCKGRVVKKKTTNILSILTDLNFQAQPNPFCFDLLASGMPERFSEGVTVSSGPSWLARLNLWVDSSPESAVHFFNSSWIWILACASCKLNPLSLLSTTSSYRGTSWERNCLH